MKIVQKEVYRRKLTVVVITRTLLRGSCVLSREKLHIQAFFGNNAVTRKHDGV
jgi:hypothetical protein